MKPIIKLLAVVLAMYLSNVALAEVVVRKEPLTREKSALSLSGQQLYQNLCAACHGKEATGQGKACETLGIHAPDLTRIDSLLSITYKTPWIELDAVVDVYGARFNGNILSRDSLVYIEHVIPKKFLFFKWGIKERKQEIISKNPNTVIIDAEFITVKE